MELFKKIVNTSGLSKLFAEGVVTNCCKKAGVAPSDITPDNLPRVIAEVEKAVRAFRPEEADGLIANLRTLR
jgi:hypothetical protein